jgi:diguanylate cyclase (GGDEF)-like protein
MGQSAKSVLFEVNPDNCVACLACVRACPVEAIAVDGTKVQVVDESCIRCGACAPACPHDAIDVIGDLGKALELAARGDAILILSVEAEVYFHPLRPEQLVNACYRSGFRVVHRGVIGDELVAEEYRRLWREGGWGTMIRSTCPVVVDTVRRKYPELVPYLAPVKTPAAAEVAYIKGQHGPDVGIVYAGPCLGEGGDGLSAVITLPELEQLFRARRVDVAAEQQYFTRVPEERRRHVSTAGGMPLPVLHEEPQSSPRFRKVRRDLTQLGAISQALTKDGIELGFVDILPCEGCLDHPLMGPKEELFWRRSIQQGYEPPRSPVPVVDTSVSVDMIASFAPVPNGQVASETDVEAVIDKIGRAPEGRPWNCGACGYLTCRSFASALLKGRATYRQCPPYQERRAQKAQEEAAVDELTGLGTFRVLRERLRNEVARSARTGEPFAVLFADLDNFKEVNDRYGHEAGNRVLVSVANVLRGVVRSSDVAARYGGDEFVVVLMGTNTEGARRVAEEVRRAVEVAGRESGFPDGLVTMSVGVTGFEPGVGAEPDVLEAADRALYRAKAAGGNRIV